jgi:predicted outer membrane repeat protein
MAWFPGWRLVVALKQRCCVLLSANQASSTNAAWNASAAVRLSGNLGGLVAAYAADVKLHNVSFLRNSVGYQGGAVSIATGGSVTITGCR